ncbi:MAG TPA: deoxyribose-phosphate aldolase [Ilumatobacter sp.]|nr:deoxyribose-phosphate aldolase [Ilumatobacter sp.]
MSPEQALLAISLVDLTNLDDRCTADAVAALCTRAAEHGVAAVCVWPDFVPQAAAVLAGTGVGVATVVNFPTGDERPYAVSAVAGCAVDDGATEVDVVLPYRALLAGDTAWVLDVLRTARVASVGTHLKVILETGELPDQDTVAAAARLAIEAGADFVKTSTGKSPVSATPEAVATMLDVIAGTDHTVGLKPSGGIRTAADAEVYLALAAERMGTDYLAPATFRFGASSLLDALIDVTNGVSPGG